MSGDEAAAKLTRALTNKTQEVFDAVGKRLHEGVASRMPALTEALLETGDAEEWHAGLQTAVQDSLISITLLMEANKHETDLRTAAHDLGMRMREIAEGIK